MGDRCALTVTFREHDRGVVEEVLGPWDQEDSHPNLPGCIVVWFSEMNYGGCNEREELAKRGIPFFGYHCAGDDYGPLAFAACGSRIDEIMADHLGEPVINIDANTGEPTKEARQIAKEYVQRLKQVHQRLRRRDRVPPKPLRRIVVEVRGGLVQCVYGDTDVDVTIVDWDTDPKDPTVVAGEDVLPFHRMPNDTKKAVQGSHGPANS